MSTKATAADIIESLFKGLDDRQKKVLTKRYGLDNGEEMTLAQLGKIFSVTRERIRQIEANALNEVKKKAKDSNVVDLVKTAIEKIKKSGGLRKEDHLLEEIKEFAENSAGVGLPVNFANQIRFLLEISGEVFYYREDEEINSHWHLSESHQKKGFDFLSDLEKHLKQKKNETIHEKKFEQFFSEIVELKKIEKEAARHYLKISKRFGENIYGDFGLTQWEEVNPRVARDWIYLILKKNNKPMHFREIADEIRRTRVLSKKTNTQTIHNELIKDKRFILVGRGIYGLRDMDNLPAGTIREILVHILKENGPMKPKEIVSNVLKNRIFKETTILFNLQNKKYFKRLSDGAYSLAK